MDTVRDLQASGMHPYLDYLEAETQIFREYGLSPTILPLELSRPHFQLRALDAGSGEPVLFLHGFSSCSTHWASLVSRLPGMHCLMLDAPGHSLADAVDFQGVNLRAWYKEMLTSCLDALGLEKVHLVGHSQGAMQALWLALDAPSRVRSVVTIGTPAVAFGARVESLRILARPGIGRFLLSLPLPPPAYRSAIASTMGRAAVHAHPNLVRATYKATHRPGFARTISSYLHEMFQGADAEPQRYVLSDAELQRIFQPVLVLWGEDDTHFQPIEEAKARAVRMPHSHFEVVSGGHEPWLNSPEKCSRLISGFHSAQR